MGDDHDRSSDEISLFLNQILLRSSSSSSSFLSSTTSCSSFLGMQAQPQLFTAPAGSIQQESYNYPHRSNVVKDGIISGLDLADRINVGYVSGIMRGSTNTTTNASSLSVGGVSENETDHECDGESEEGLEALVEEVLAAKVAPPRSSSKRSRAAEVHNLSEKRRRSRINEKMKALQNLIPNSNKTDKASMLDEAIEYLKQLQLQVQMLSLRNGVGLHPMGLPGMLQPIQFSQFSRGFTDENGSQPTNIAGSLPLNQENPEQIVFDLPNQCAVSNQLALPNMSSVINSETSFNMESSIRSRFGAFPLRSSSEDICRQEVLPHRQLSGDHSERIPSEFELQGTATVSLPFEKQASNLKDSGSLGACIIGRDQNECLFLKNMEHNVIISPNLHRSQTGRSDPGEDAIKIERREI